jgi:hypothetical protein
MSWIMAARIHAAKGSRDAFTRFLNGAGDEPPGEGDTLP